MLEHGGRLRRAAEQSGSAIEHWLDLSTGISPWSWIDERPLSIPSQCWMRLPEEEDDLASAALQYYGAEALPVAGSQAAIQALPRLRSASRVGVLKPSYAEHAQAWQQAGHTVTALSEGALLATVDRLDVLILAQPNNPDGSLRSIATLRALHARLAARGGWLVLDEAFIDTTPAVSLAEDSAQPGLIVLRSLGKFFGLAGARVGFVLAHVAVRNALWEILGPWTLAGPSRYIAAAALRDTSWQIQQRARLLETAMRMDRLLAAYDLPADGRTSLFHWLQHAQADVLHRHFAQSAILTRHFSEPSSLRFGLPKTEADWQRLEAALQKLPAILRGRRTAAYAA